jgi:hypothetical protein
LKFIFIWYFPYRKLNVLRLILMLILRVLEISIGWTIHSRPADYPARLPQQLVQPIQPVAIAAQDTSLFDRLETSDFDRTPATIDTHG